MWPYWLLLIAFGYAATKNNKVNFDSSLKGIPWATSWVCVFVLLSLMIGLRHEVGGDWQNYIDKSYQYLDRNFIENLQENEPAYAVLNGLSINLGGIYFVNLVCGIIFSYGLVTFCKSQNLPWLALTVSIPYLVIVVAMGYSRQGVAIGLVMLGFDFLKQNKIKYYLTCVMLAALFHISAIVMFPFAVLSSRQLKIRNLIIIIIILLLLFYFQLSQNVENYQIGYIEQQYNSSGATIRVVMNLVPSIFFLIYRKNYLIPNNLLRLWTSMSLFGILLFFTLILSPSSTAVDRISLYLIPLQMIVWSGAPYALEKKFERSFSIWIIVFIYFIIQYVWLYFSVFSYLWYPYQFYPTYLIFS